MSETALPSSTADIPSVPAVQEEEEEEAAWEREQGIPQLSDPFLQKYFQGRDALLAQEDKQRSDRNFRELMSPMAQEACAIVDQIRFEELQTVWTAELEEELARSYGGEVYPGMMFTLAKSRMEKTKLWKIVRKMPKGALLHMHLDAMVDQEWLFNTAIDEEGLHIRAPVPLDTAESREKTVFQFQKTVAESAPEISIWDSKYPAMALYPLKAAAESFPDGGREGMVRWLKSRCSISDEESLSHHHGCNAIWRKFSGCFTILRHLIPIEPILRKYLHRMFTQMAQDGISWVDIRAILPLDFQPAGSEEKGHDPIAAFEVFQDEIEKFKATEEGKNFWGARIIWTSMRIWDNRTLAENMKKCIETKLAFPDLLAGYDLVGQEDKGRSAADLTPMIFWFRKQCAEAGVNIPFYFHAGETCSSGGEPDMNLFDAILLGTRRIGHGFSLYKHPLLMNMVRDRGILIECCPISNEVLRLTSSIMSHPLPALLAQGVPVALSNDDPAVLGHDTAGLTHDFFQSLLGIENLGLAGLGALAENSVRWATLEDDLDSKEWTQDIKNGPYGTGIRAKRMKEWKSSWEKFCQWIVMEFGVDIDEDPEE